ncbi:MAG: hypothetical protein DHS20C18_15240 [Saprospiraceae bacterium]|nr:MAG: hypothetical protein DHS20C18_15240 [Saprospiraceae bacterium]
MSKKNVDNQLLLLLARIACVSVFWGRAWQHLFWDAPFRTLLWDEKWMRPIIEGVFGMSWTSYVTSPSVGNGIETSIVLLGWFYLLAGFAALVYPFAKTINTWIIRIGGGFLLFLAFLYWKEKFYYFGQFFEYTLQVFTPFFFIWLYTKGTITMRMQGMLKIAIALTFACHGLYAIGFYPQPEHFLTMPMNILHLNNEQAKMFLNLAGIADFVLSICLFLPWRKVNMVALAYAVFWGFMTSLARIWAYFYLEDWMNNLHQWSFQFLYRAPHFLLPAVLFLFYWDANPKAVKESFK